MLHNGSSYVKLIMLHSKSGQKLISVSMANLVAADCRSRLHSQLLLRIPHDCDETLHGRALCACLVACERAGLNKVAAGAVLWAEYG